jgi:hypothetical protein
MKKYLMTVMAAVALGGMFTGCTKDADLSGGQNSAEFNIVQNYENAFITRFGQPHPNQTWGFGESVAGTRGHNANANEWADPDKEYGGWVVPDALDEKQKLRVKAYFQYNQYPGGTSCDYTDFFVQQVYKGNPSTKGPYSDEQYQSANGGWVVGSNHMDHLTAGSIHDHINNFNYGDYSGGGTVTVLDNGQHVNGGSTHQDQIMLMVNSQTDCFGYWNSDGSLGHDDRYRLVSAQTIDDWIDAHTDLGFGPSYGMKVVDDWDRHFIGFDFDQVAGRDVYANNNGTIYYAKYSESPAGNTQYMVVEEDITSHFDLANPWNNQESASKNGDNIIVYNGKQWGGLCYGGNKDWSSYGKLVVEFAQPTAITTQVLIQDTNGNSKFTQQVGSGATKLEFDFNGKGNDLRSIGNVAFQPADNGTVYISKIYLLKAGSFNSDQYINSMSVPYLKSETNQYCGLRVQLNDNDVKQVLNNQQCVYKSKIDQMISDGYLPVYGSNFKDWVKVQGGADGYYSDWIVTICKAINEKDNEEEEEEEEETDDPSIVCRIIVEDLTVGESSDFDFNDVVFDVCKNGTLIIRAIGGELPIYIGAEGANEVHAACSVTLDDTQKGANSHMMMRNTGWSSSGSKTNVGIVYNKDLGHISLNRTFNSKEEAKEIEIWVHKNGTNIRLQAPVGKVASMICVGQDYKWCAERQDIDDKYHKDGVKLFHQYVIGDPNYGDDWEHKNAWYQKLNQ